VGGSVFMEQSYLVHRSLAQQPGDNKSAVPIRSFASCKAKGIFDLQRTWPSNHQASSASDADQRLAKLLLMKWRNLTADYDQTWARLSMMNASSTGASRGGVVRRGRIGCRWTTKQSRTRSSSWMDRARSHQRWSSWRPRCCVLPIDVPNTVGLIPDINSGQRGE